MPPLSAAGISGLQAGEDVNDGTVLTLNDTSSPQQAGLMTVTASIDGQEPVTIAQLSTDHPAVLDFIHFWLATVMIDNCDSWPFAQLIRDMAALKVNQDADCPHLFIDYRRSRHEGSTHLYAMLKATDKGTVTDYNPDLFFRNQAYALASNQRVKVFSPIYNNPILPRRLVAGVVTTAGDFPAFDHDRPFDTFDAVAASASELSDQPIQRAQYTPGYRLPF
ncbi:MAG: hypothetical protein AWU57_589 [Marinobacter sp. T13-3]|nr:MAG: hypothetical protein AWU57_589 [Marinobacter sp. T13-3]